MIKFFKILLIITICYSSIFASNKKREDVVSQITQEIKEFEKRTLLTSSLLYASRAQKICLTQINAEANTEKYSLRFCRKFYKKTLRLKRAEILNNKS